MRLCAGTIRSESDVAWKHTVNTHGYGWTGRGERCWEGGRDSICWFTPQQCSISAIDILGLVLRALCEGERGTVLDRNNPKVNLPHGSLNRVQYKPGRGKRNLQLLFYSQGKYGYFLQWISGAKFVSDENSHEKVIKSFGKLSLWQFTFLQTFPQYTIPIPLDFGPHSWFDHCTVSDTTKKI